MSDDIRPYARPQEGRQPPYLHPDYTSTVTRAPRRRPVRIEHTLTEITGPVFADRWAGPDVADLTRGHGGPPLGERIIVAGRVLDEDGRPAALHCQSSTRVPGTGRPSSSSTRPATMMRSPSGGPPWPRVKSATSGPAQRSAKTGPVISVSVCSIRTGRRLGARVTVLV